MNNTEVDRDNRSEPPVFEHLSVLSRELVEGLGVRSGGRYLDATLGAGGHSQLILEAAADVWVTGIDRDESAIATAQSNLSAYRSQVQFWHGNFADFPIPENGFDGIIADLGVSSGQLDLPDRGFSFRHSAPLDMRMDRRQDLTAAEIVNHWQEVELANLIYEYGEERLSRRIARQIVQQRPFQTTTDLAQAIARSVPRSYRYGRIHPATRTFQALRIAVNQELSSLETFLNRAIALLEPEGTLGVISFHSLEDRMVKHFFRETPQLQVLTKKPIVPQEDELKTNPRARSAKLRFARKRAEQSV